MRVLLRFLGFVAIPALLAPILLWTASDREVDRTRDRSLARAAEAELALLIDASVTTTRLRESGRVLSAFDAVTGFRSSMYRGDAWIAGDSTAPARLPGRWKELAETGRASRVLAEEERRGVLIRHALADGAAAGAPGTGDLGAPGLGADGLDAPATIHLLVREDRTPARAVGSIARAVTGVLLLFAVGATVLGLSPGPHATRWVLVGVLLLTTTVAGAVGWTITRTAEVERRSVVRDMTRAAALMKARGVEPEPTLASRVTGHRALFIDTAGTASASDGSSLPGDVESLPSPPAAFPATGRLISTGELYLVTKTSAGRSVLFLETDAISRTWAASAFAVLFFGAGLLFWLRTGPVRREVSS